jgi:hypothetical protein
MAVLTVATGPFPVSADIAANLGFAQRLTRSASVAAGSKVAGSGPKTCCANRRSSCRGCSDGWICPLMANSSPACTPRTGDSPEPGHPGTFTAETRSHAILSPAAYPRARRGHL